MFTKVVQILKRVRPLFQCCGQFNGQKDPLGHGSLTNSDSLGRAVHSAVVSEFDNAINGSGGSLDPVDGKTYGESTTRYDNLGRPIARTQWLLARGTIDKTNPPIAGLDGIATSEGITSQTYYDSNLGDNICYGPNCGRSFGRIVTVGIWGSFAAVGGIVENSGEPFRALTGPWPNCDRIVCGRPNCGRIVCSRPNWGRIFCRLNRFWASEALCALKECDRPFQPFALG